MTDGIFLSSEDKMNVGAVTIAGFSIFAGTAMSEGVEVLFFVTISCIYYVATRRMNRHIGFVNLLSTVPITLLASIVAVSSAFGFANLFGYELEGTTATWVKTVIQIFAICWFGVFLWYMLGNFLNDYLKSSQGKWATRYLYSSDQAFMVGDIVLTLMLGWLYYTVQAGCVTSWTWYPADPKSPV